MDSGREGGPRGKAWRDGTTHILMERHELLERLVSLIPPPRAHQVRYHGVLASCASARDRVVIGPRRTIDTIRCQKIPILAQIWKHPAGGISTICS